jgi:hypothetical protein
MRASSSRGLTGLTKKSSAPISSAMISQLTEEGYGPWPEIFKEQVSFT